MAVWSNLGYDTLRDYFVYSLKSINFSKEEIQTLMSQQVDSFMAVKKPTQARHVMGVTLIGMTLDDILGFGDGLKKDMATIRAKHDIGKLSPACLPYVDPPVFQDWMRKNMEYHVSPEVIPMDLGVSPEMNLPGRFGIHFHHGDQMVREAYPRIPLMEVTPAGKMVARLIAIPDDTESALHRNGTIPTEESAFARVMADYESLPLEYDGPLFPRIKTTGGEILRQLKEKEVFKL